MAKEAQLEAIPETSPPTQDLSDQKRNRKILWSIVLVVWFVLNAYVIRQELNPHYVNPSYHIPLDDFEGKWEEGVYINADEGGGIYLPTRWKDPETKKVYHMDHPEVIDGIKREKWARGIVTFFLGIPIIIFNYLRSHNDYGSKRYLFEKFEGLRNNMIVLIIVSLFLGSSSAADSIVYTLESLLFCFIFIAPFIYWEKIQIFFTGKRSKSEGK
jgi:hypothetical protein